MTRISTYPSFLIAALLAGRLYRVFTIAKTMSISSSNAKAISIRGGTKTVGFKPITEFISEMAKDTISISNKINDTALEFSKIAVNENRAIVAINKFKKVINKLDNQNQINNLSSIVNKLDENSHLLNEQQI